jgi:ABC-type nitrate/sulfonate/bicarbonate transport system substrate-binding protein
MAGFRKSGVRRTRRQLLQSAPLLGAALVVGWRRPGLAQSQKLEQMRIFIGSNPSFGSIMIAEEKGFFANEGLPVQVTKFASGSTAIDAFRAGRGDMVCAGDLPSLRLWQQAGVGVCPEANYGELNVIVAKKSITKPADLQNKKLGTIIGSTSEYLARRYLAAGGVDYKRVEFINLTPAGMVTGLVRGDIDAFACFQPFGWRAIKADHDSHIVTVTAPYFREWLLVNTTPEYARSHDREIIAFLKALSRSAKWIPANLDEATQIIAKSLSMDDPETVKMMLQVIDWEVTSTQKLRADMEQLGDFFGVPVAWDKSFDSRFLAQLKT